MRPFAQHAGQRLGGRQPGGAQRSLVQAHPIPGFLVIQCENTFSGALKRDEKGRLLSTKREEGHGFGLSQMRAVAEKYHSVLDVSWEEGRFTVQTALKA